MVWFETILVVLTLLTGIIWLGDKLFFAKARKEAAGLLDEKGNAFHGRPTYALPLQDGSLLVSDEQNGAVYRITYGAPKTASR